MNKTGKMKDSAGYDEIAETIFGPLYKDIAETMIARTGVTGGRFLDVGCGGGHMGLAICEQGDFSGVMMDLSEEAVAIAEKRIAGRGWDGRLSAVCANVEQMPFEDHSFDLVISRGSVFFWEDKEKAFREIHRVMKPGAWAYIGGGMGSREHRERVHALMEERGIQPHRRSSSNTFTDQEYERLFREMQVPFSIIHNEDEGHWVIFQKPPQN